MIAIQMKTYVHCHANDNAFACGAENDGDEIRLRRLLFMFVCFYDCFLRAHVRVYV